MGYPSSSSAVQYAYMSRPFSLTTTLPYVNAAPHIGFGLEITEADVIARYRRLLGDEVIFNTGTDEHGLKIYQSAQEQNKSPLEYCDEYAAKFADLCDQLNLSYDRFIRTTNPDHMAAAQEFWRRSNANGFIYKKLYQVKYCVGCELEKTESELDETGRCPLHPNRELELIDEENYFFKFSAFQEPLLAHYRANPEFVQPAEKMREIVSFVEHGLQDFSVSRLKSKMPWGVPVPDDDEHVMYVWFDALVNYISTLGWPDESPESDYSRFWPGVQLAGKDNLRQQSAMWQAMLLSAKLPLSDKILINGFISVDGTKMSKSLGNVIAPVDMVERYGSDATRFLLISLGTFQGDMDVTWDRFDQLYTAHLANGFGNLCSRIAKLCEKVQVSLWVDDTAPEPVEFSPEFAAAMDRYDLSGALQIAIDRVAATDAWLSETKPWELTGDEQYEVLLAAAVTVRQIAFHLQPFMPTVSEQVFQHFGQPSVTALTPLFPRLSQPK